MHGCCRGWQHEMTARLGRSTARASDALQPARLRSSAAGHGHRVLLRTALHRNRLVSCRSARTFAVSSKSALAAAAAEKASDDFSVDGAARVDTLVLDGKAAADAVCDNIRHIVEQYQATQNSSDKPGLAVIIAGGRRDSLRYVQRKAEQANLTGFHSRILPFPESVTSQQLLTAIDELNADERVHGILVQLPLPEQVEQSRVLERVSIEKDVDGFHPYNMGLLALNWKGAGQFVPWEKVHRTIEVRPAATQQATSRPAAAVSVASTDSSTLFNIPCAPRACLELLRRHDISVRGKHCVVLGRSAIVGLPLTLLLLHSNATVTNCHHLTPTHDVRALCQQADVIISATGQPQLIQRDWVRRGAVVVDVGINFVKRRDGGSGSSVADGADEDARDGVELVGDVDTASLMGHAAAVTPVPGGVGPMTVAMLLENTLHNWIRSKGGEKQRVDYQPPVR